MFGGLGLRNLMSTFLRSNVLELSLGNVLDLIVCRKPVDFITVA